MRTHLIVQHDDGTPTGSRSTSFFIRGILGPDAWSIFMRWLRRLAERFSVAASLVGHPGDGWRFRRGCSIGRPAQSPGHCQLDDERFDAEDQLWSVIDADVIPREHPELPSGHP